MPTLTLDRIPDDVMERLRKLAEAGHRSVPQQATLLLERAVAETPLGFGAAYDRFRDAEGPSPLSAEELENLRAPETGREVEL